MRGFDRDLCLARGIGRLCGVDEAGRGPLAGPVVAAAVILPPDWNLPGLDDSKRLREEVRRRLEGEIRHQALAWALGEATVEEIDRLNILQATFLAMGRAVSALDVTPDFLLVDGRDFPFNGRAGRALIKGDTLSASVAAASILAKQARDRWMESASRRWPGYGFECHKGYGTAAHLRALAERGACPLHRLSFAPVRQLGRGDVEFPPGPVSDCPTGEILP
jgi:ribonuclease HII